MKLLNKVLPFLLAGVVQVAVLLTLSSGVHSQTVWKHLEAGDQEISFSLPDGFLLNKDPSSRNNEIALLGFVDGVTLKASISAPLDPIANLSRIRIDTLRSPTVLDFEINGFRGRSITMTDRGYEHKLFLASKKTYYVFEVISETKDHSTVVTFLRSIRVKGQPIIDSAAGEPISSNEKMVSIKSLKPSHEVTEAHKRKAGKFIGKLTFEPLAALQPCSQDPNVRPAFLVNSLSPDYGSLIPNRGMAKMAGDVWINVRLLSDGRVGDIVIYSDLEKPVVRVFSDAAKKLKFVPAELNGKPVDHCESIRMGFGVTTSTFITTMPQ